MTSRPQAPPGLTRRRLLAAPALGIALSPPALLSACGGDEDPASADLGVLNDLLAGEHLQAAVYARASRFLDGGALELAELFAEQEGEHAELLGELVIERGGTPVEARSERRNARRLRLGRVDDREEYLQLAVDMENATVGAYQQALIELSSPELRRTAYSIVAVEAEQMSVLLGELGRAQVPDPFVAGISA